MTKPPQNACIIYVFGQQDGQVAKLGKTRNRAELRMKQHETRGPTKSPMRPLVLLHGHDSDEKALIRYWEKHGVPAGGKEWFQPSEPFKQWLRFMRQQPYVARDLDDIDKMSFVDSRHWLPSEKHRLQQVQGRLVFNNDPWADIDFDDEGDGDFYTNRIVIDAARQALGGIDLDPASCRLANSVVRATRYFGAYQDGLTQDWEGRIWLNPPFGQWDLWAPKLLRELQSGRVDRACMLCPSRATTSKALHQVIGRSQAMVIPSGRQKFWGPKAGTPDEGHFIFYFGDDIEAFRSAFEPIGHIFIHSLESFKANSEGVAA